eukprot:m.170993 g.170993  ORF g.170993 m.170993 type:complete len:111 (+) comp17833_c0_seq21:2682-3014(+)
MQRRLCCDVSPDTVAVQVLSPFRSRGRTSVDHLNDQLQDALNPRLRNPAVRSLFNKDFRLGDKVMNVVNDVEREVYNGDIGTVSMVNLKQVCEHGRKFAGRGNRIRRRRC